MSLKSAKRHDVLLARQRARETGEDFFGMPLLEQPLWQGGPSTLTLQRQATSLTSAAARERNAPKAPSQREKVYNAIWQAEPVGITRKDLADHLHLSENAVRPRVKELEQAGYVHDHGTSVKDGCARIRILRSPYSHRECAAKLRAIRAAKEAAK